MSRGAWQVIRDRSVLVELEARLHQVREYRRHAAQLSVAESVLEPRFGKEFAVLVLQALGSADRAEAELTHDLLDPGEEGFLVPGDLREEQDMRRLGGL